ncbi:hypothetical protein MNBD_GAMMA01-1579 [hydrothermal vent metagenome]|uniref:Uncharacterized protein n=1 Tax=hydrothermal vent metagenome TaxID=652676 RepID=A0A3B0UT43_9ZZZZ
MKYSIIICPNDKNSKATLHALGFINALINKKPQHISVFFYGYAVETAFMIQSAWHEVARNNVTLTACSTIAESYLNQQLKTAPYFNLAGLGQWMEAIMDADKYIEFG